MKTDYSKIPTETVNIRSKGLDMMSALEIAQLMNQEDATVAQKVNDTLPQIAQAIEMVADAFRAGGRLIYFGAGTSGRLGVLDASECPPTFSADPNMVIGVMAGGKTALIRAKEGAEDHPQNGARAIMRLKASSKDVICGIASSGVTPFVLGAMEKARAIPAKTLFVTCNPNFHNPWADIQIKVDTGPEILQGSTRLKAGTATKMVLNMLTTGAMIRIGKVYGNRMVDLTPTCLKLRERAQRIVAEEGNIDTERAKILLEETNWQVKQALLRALCDCDNERAKKALVDSKGHLSLAVTKLLKKEDK